MTVERSPAIPLGILAAAMFVWAGAVALNQMAETSRLKEVRANQEALVQNSQKLRASLDALASETAKLAAQGNPNAKMLVDELAKRGITINPNAPQR